MTLVLRQPRAATARVGRLQLLYVAEQARGSVDQLHFRRFARRCRELATRTRSAAAREQLEVWAGEFDAWANPGGDAVPAAGVPPGGSPSLCEATEADDGAPPAS
jgi:hypothetical protein